MAKDVNGNEIKAGMKVKRVEGANDSEMKVGRVYEVASVSKVGLYLQNQEKERLAEYFKIVSTPETQKAEKCINAKGVEIKVGETYIVDGGCGDETGSVITIDKFADGYFYYTSNIRINGTKRFGNESGFMECLNLYAPASAKPSPELHAFKVGDRVRLIARPENYCGMSERDFPVGGKFDIDKLRADIFVLLNNEGYRCEVLKNQIEKLPDDKPSEGAKFLDRYGNELKVGDRIKVIDKTFLNIKGEETYITRLENDCGRLKIWSKDKEGESYCTLKEFDGRYELLRGGKHFNQVIWDDFVPKHWSADYDVVEGKTALELYNEEKNHKSLAVKSLYF